jgi:hypothetical protein
MPCVIDPNLKLSCITFGAPPTLSVDVTGPLLQATELAANRGNVLAFANEFDLIPRADQSYLRSLIDLHQSMYGMDSAMAGTITCAGRAAGGGSTSYILPPLRFEMEGLENDEKFCEKIWRLPVPDYYIIGELVLLTKRRDFVAGKKRRVLLASTISQREFQKLLYCGTQTHSRSCYDDRVKLLLQGNFNKHESW